MKKCFKYILFIWVLSLSSCSKNSEINESSFPISLPKKSPRVFNKPQELIEFVNDTKNGFVKTKTINEITYSVFLKPDQYVKAKNQHYISIKDSVADDKTGSEFQLFDVRIEVGNFQKEFIKYDLESIPQYEERVKYCSFEMQNDIVLIDGKDTLPCVIFHFERTFDIVPFGHFLLGFKNNPSKDIKIKTIIFNDRLFNNGFLKFSFSPELMVNEPVLL
jgi:hypothetical protein